MEEEIVEVEKQEMDKPKKKGKGTFFIGFIIGIILASLAAWGLRVADSVVQLKDVDTLTKKMQVIYGTIKENYYQDVDDEAVIEGAYKGMLESLNDPYSVYMTAKEYEDFMVDVYGDFCGVGAQLQQNQETKEVIILNVFKDSPAQKAGLEVGDLILSVDDEFYAKDMTLDEYVTHIRGTKGTEVKLHIKRGEEEFDAVCIRDQILTPTVSYEMQNDNVGYIAISQFAANTSNDMKEAVEDLVKQGATSLIFDLRNNGGGMLDVCVDMLDYLLPEGTVVYTVDAKGERVDYNSDAKQYVDMPMAVIVNGYSASASEIFTGALKDYKWATIVGSTTFGKGIVQTTIPLRDRSAIKLTTMSYYTPSGVCIHGLGIDPDIAVEDDENTIEDEVYEAAIKAVTK